MSIYVTNPHVPAMKISAYPRRTRFAGGAADLVVVSGTPSPSETIVLEACYADFFREPVRMAS